MDEPQCFFYYGSFYIQKHRNIEKNKKDYSASSSKRPFVFDLSDL